MKKSFFYPLTISLSLALGACSSPFETTYSQISNETVQKLACPTFEATFWDGIKEFILQHNDFPESTILSRHVEEKVKNISTERPDLSEAELQNLSTALTSLIQFVFAEALASSRTPQEMLVLISGVDVGDVSTLYKAYLKSEVEQRISQIKDYVEVLNLTCDQEVLPEDPESLSFIPPEVQSGKLPLPVWGARFTVATAYQSCQAARVPAVNERTEAVRGIVITGTHSDGVGSKRQIASVSDVLRTHPYYQDVSTYPQGCFNLKSSPLIYDYGGKPYATTSASSMLDLFRDAGTGTKVLGIDCSGFTFTAFATAGLRLQKGRVLKASDTYSWGSGAYVEPQKNGLTCLDKIAVTSQKTLSAGDIVAVYGHLFIIDAVGADPLGISKARTAADCQKLSTSDFDFKISQSSNSKSGLGINVYEARDFVETSPKFKVGLAQYAKISCQARFDGKTYTPSIGTLSVVRHKGTPECLAPRVVLAREECVRSCPL